MPNRSRRALFIGLATLATGGAAILAGRTPGTPPSRTAAAIVQLDPHTVRINRAALAHEMPETRGAPLAALSRSARLVPELRAGRVGGIRLFSVQPAGLAGRLGLRNADIVRAIDGRPIEGPHGLLALAANIGSPRRLTVAVERAGTPVNLVYLIE